ncbi:RICIN domain-containing protein [Mucilaginibacter limnophilus]|nr:RICIN domain-containing protein [Mucilaginibacter limnophilus]
MKKKLLSGAVALLLLTQACRKTEVAEKNTQLPVTTIENSSGLRLNAVGDYGTYQVIGAENGKSARIQNFSIANGGMVELANYDNAAHSKWRITYTGNNYYKIMNLGSGKMLESHLFNGQYLLVQVSSRDIDEQLWGLTEVGNKQYIAVNKASRLAATLDANGKIKLEAYSGKASQKFGYNELQNTAYRDDDVVNFFHRRLPSQGSVAFDQGSSIPLTWGANAGKVLWIAEDSFDGSRLVSATNANLQCGFFQYNNSVLIQPSLTDWNPDNTPNMTIANSAQGRPRQVFDNQPGTDWSWPGVGVEIGDKVYVYNGEGKGLGITNQSLFELKQEAGTQWQVKRTTPAGLSNQTDIGYAVGMVKPGDGYVYSYGSKGVFFNTSNVYVARFPESDPQDWSFWNGTVWSKTRTSDNKASIATTQQNVNISYLNGKYIMMVMDLGWFCDPEKHNIYMATATSPLGPFTSLKYVFTIEDRYRGHLNRYYTPMIHPEFNNGKNELLITYSVNFNECNTGDNCKDNQMESIQYQVKGVRVPYSLIGL